MKLFNVIAILALALLGSPKRLEAATVRVPTERPSIQAAIDAAVDGDVIVVAAGHYRERLRLKAGVALRSAGDEQRGELGLLRAERTVLDGGGDGARAGVEMAEGATLDGFTVTKVGVYDGALWDKHHATQGEEQAHDHIGAPGIPGIAATGVSCVIRNNIVHHNGYSGVAIVGVEGQRCAPVVTANICFRNMGAGIASMAGSVATISNNRCFENFYAGIGHSSASPTVTENICHSNIRAGIGISEGACPLVRDNRCYRNLRAGIGIRTGAETRPDVVGNACYENEMAGIGSRDGARPVLRSNKCYKNKLAGIGARGGASPVLLGNECYENGLAGIGLSEGVTAMVVGNHSHHNGAAGIGFDDCTGGSAVVADNRFIDNAAVAAGVHAGWKVRFTGNTMSREGGMPPIVMVFAGAEAIFVSNTIQGGGVAGIRTAGIVRVENNRILGAAVRKAGPPNFAVWALEGADVRLTGNEIRSWRHALVADKADVDATGNTVRDFHREAFVVRDAPRPPRLANNDAE